MDIGTVIKERRAILGISQQDLSDYSGVGISTVKDLERGVANPSLQTLRKILDVVGMEMVLQVSLDYNEKEYLRYSALLHYIADLWFLMLCTYNLEIDLESGIHLHTIVFHLHCAVLIALIVA